MNFYHMLCYSSLSSKLSRSLVSINKNILSYIYAFVKGFLGIFVYGEFHCSKLSTRNIFVFYPTFPVYSLLGNLEKTGKFCCSFISCFSYSWFSMMKPYFINRLVHLVKCCLQNASSILALISHIEMKFLSCWRD